MELSAFKAYDIRGRVPEELDEGFAYRLGRAYVEKFAPASVLVGHDARLESPALAAALARGVREGGADVVDIGLCGTEEVYFQTFHRKTGGGVMVTASHNPKGYNGMKLVREGSKPVSGDSGLHDLREMMREGGLGEPSRTGRLFAEPDKGVYVEHLLGYVDRAALRPLKIVANPGNGCAGPVVRLLEARLPFEFVLVQEEPDGEFPSGIPNPLLPENRAATAEAVVLHGADFGIAWDGDFDRCFFFDSKGRFIEGYYLVGLLAEVMLRKHPGSRIIHDPRLCWNTIEQVRAAGGVPVQSKTGHAFIKERMRAEDAVYGGEMSAHHYFREFAYCDSGMIPWLLVAELVSKTGRSLAELVEARMRAFPCSGEINYRVLDAAAVISRIEARYAAEALRLDRTDGLSMEFEGWRFNLRSSNTEPLLRLNVETRGSLALLDRQVGALETLIRKG
ncbi:phosphomannomutase [Chlorobium sp. N1]|uniref:phosphomannomutase n=1 Tax=Chlorobium sp. N1 TaxID=2491138 RepID=UPI001038AD7A|nr:phosphomannomutase [Chlorobium sp. N1]TCD47541.1 phosphomannomutase [Chlorobium sp. N1]